MFTYFGEFWSFLGIPTIVHFLLNGQKKVNQKHALRQSRREKPSALLYRPIITPQHLWLDCYFFFVYSNKEKVTKKACPEQGRGKPILLSFSAMRKKVSKERIADTALSASSCSIPIVLTLILYLLLASLTIWLFHHHILC